GFILPQCIRIRGNTPTKSTAAGVAAAIGAAFNAAMRSLAMAEMIFCAEIWAMTCSLAGMAMIS
ncbi:MAG: hypothetical protein ACPGFC_12800, partial [Paracoccaceae bacterium]